jgi:outer membrane lipoprotein-sorting protein
MHPIVFALSLLSLTHTPDDTTLQFDPAAKKVLESMVKAYKDVRRLEQETTYHRTDGSAAGAIRSHLAMQKPNRLFLEVVHKSPDWPTEQTARFVCDGKSFYAYQQKNGWFTKEAAPKDFKEFDFLALSVEMAALTGNDPSKALLSRARSLRLEGPETIDGEVTDVVVLDTGSAAESAETRLFVSRTDHLLRRFAFESKPIQRTAEKKEGDDVEFASQPSQPTAYSYDVHVMRGREQTKDAFTWVPPTGAFQYQNFPNAFDRQVDRKQAPAPPNGMPPGVTPMKVYSIQELLKNAKDAEKKRKKK